jgi:hypothetical protein
MRNDASSAATSVINFRPSAPLSDLAGHVIVFRRRDALGP